MSERRVVVTGLGIETAIASNTADFARAIMEGVSGVDTIGLFDTAGYRTDRAAWIKNLKAEDSGGRMYAILDHICSQAIPDGAALGDPGSVGVAIGSCLGNADCLDRYYEALIKGGADRAEEIMDQPHIHAAVYVAERYGFYNIVAGADTACSSAASAVGFSIERIRSGKAAVMITGGVDPFSRLSQGGFGALKNLSVTESRPLSGDCDGIVLGEGGGLLVLEELEHARNRNAQILCELPGYGLGNDAYHETKPDPASGGAIRALKDCLEDSGLSEKEVDYVNAHGTGTRLNDSMELNAVVKVFGGYLDKLAVSTIKPMVGHTLGASGAIELIACILSMRENRIPPTIHFCRPMEGYEAVDVVPNRSRPADRLEVSLSSSFAFGGNMAVLACKKYEQPGDESV